MNKIKNTKKATLILSLLLLFLVIGAASAADDKISEDDLSAPTDSVDEVASVDNDERVSTAENTLGGSDASYSNQSLKSVNDDNVLSDGESGDYDDFKTEVTGSGNITLKYKYYTLDKLPSSGATDEAKNSAILLVNSNTCIDGQGAVVDGQDINNDYRLFYMKNVENFTFKNINFKNILTADGINYRRSMGSAGGWDGGQKGTICYCDFGCKNILFENCTFTDIYGWTGGAVYIRGDIGNYDDYSNPTHNHDGAVNVTFIDCDFIRVHASNSGGAINFHEKHIRGGGVINCNFINVTSANYGAAFEMYVEYGIVENCSFIGGIAYGGGGAFNLCDHANNVTIKNCEFINNTARDVGGAFRSGDNCKFTVISNCTFYGNKVERNGGGAVVFKGVDSVIKDCVFISNSAYNGGAVSFEGNNCNVTNCNFTGNNATKHGGGIYFAANNGYVKNCNFVNNTAEGDGGGMCSQAKEGSISYVETSRFKGNSAPEGTDFYVHDGSEIRFIGLKFASLWLTNDNHMDGTTNASVLNGYGTGCNRPARWDTDAMNFLDTTQGKTTIYLVGNITNLPEKILDIPNLEIVGVDAVMNPNGAVVNLSGWNHRAFTANATGIKFTNLVFMNANIQNLSSDNDGGAIKITAGGCQISGCNFTRNYAVNGGAVSLNLTQNEPLLLLVYVILHIIMPLVKVVHYILEMVLYH